MTFSEPVRAEKLFALLLTEKTLADSQIGGFADLNLKVLAFFGAAVTLLGWLFAGKDPSSKPLVTSGGIVCLVMVAISCAVILQGLSTYGLALGYIQYKHEYLNERFRLALEEKEPPLQAVRQWGLSEAMMPVLSATGGLLLLHAGVCMVLLLAAAYSFTFSGMALVGIGGGWLLLAMTVATEVSLARALNRVFDPELELQRRSQIRRRFAENEV